MVHFSSLLVVVPVILLTGFVGGLRNWLTSLSPINNWVKFWSRVVEGAIASATVPLFLSIVGNEKVRAVFGTIDFMSADYQQSLLILVGFCLLAAITSTRFLDSISDKIMFTELKDKVQQVETEISKTNEIVNAQVEGDVVPPAALTAEPSNVSDNDRKLLQALSGGAFTIRSAQGLAANTGLAEDDVVSAMKRLEELQLVRGLSTSKGRRWVILEAGLALLMKEKN